MRLDIPSFTAHTTLASLAYQEQSIDYIELLRKRITAADDIY